MYLAHFNLSESPFSITPDPRFVYLTRRHREALAHLLYGLGEGGGFVQLTGEVGTGKTTICRTLLRQLPENVDAALIFNPQLKVSELLESLCTELHIGHADHRLSIKELVDRLYAYLLDANARGRLTVLILDEAQNLAPELLEEVRLLTNLETDDRKLLQVFLIGQPELRSKLASESLRQVSQRITARYHIEPLDKQETGLYIRHRLSVAGCTRDLFTRAAVRNVHRYSGGIPRRINILCDRALLGAYATDAKRIDGAIVRRAQAEINGEHDAPALRPVRYAGFALAGAVLLALTGLALDLHAPGALERAAQRAAATLGLARPPGGATLDSASGPESAPAFPTPQAGSDAPPGADPLAAVLPVQAGADAARIAIAAIPTPNGVTLPPPPPPPVADLEALMASVEGDGSAQALDALARLWDAPPLPAGAAVCEWASTQGLACYAQDLSVAQLRSLDLPAVLRLTGPGNTRVRALLSALSEDDATLVVEGRAQRVALSELEQAWDGEQLLLWRPPLASSRWIQLGHSGPRVRWLRDTLASIQGTEPEPGADATFDAGLQERVRAFQRRNAIEDDGIVGPQTFIRLIGLASADSVPSLSSPAAATTVGPPTGALALGSP